MYDDLIRCLRYDADASNCCEEAADAIQALICKVADEHNARLDAEDRQRWIPVTERLPFADSGDVSQKVLVTDGQDMATAEWFNFEMCEPFWSYTGMGDITHWMPLPEPPKEGEP